MNRKKYKSVRMRCTIWDFHFSRLLILGNPPKNDVITLKKNSFFFTSCIAKEASYNSQNTAGKHSYKE